VLRIAVQEWKDHCARRRAAATKWRCKGCRQGRFLCATYESETLRLERGDSIVFFSDGLSDTKNNAGDFFGTERIREVCSSML